jgi:hypothetical protein
MTATSSSSSRLLHLAPPTLLQLPLLPTGRRFSYRLLSWDKPRDCSASGLLASVGISKKVPTGLISFGFKLPSVYAQSKSSFSSSTTMTRRPTILRPPGVRSRHEGSVQTRLYPRSQPLDPRLDFGDPNSGQSHRTKGFYHGRALLGRSEAHRSNGGPRCLGRHEEGVGNIRTEVQGKDAALAPPYVLATSAYLAT